MKLLDNYNALLVKIDTLCSRTSASHAAQIVCRQGCAACCQHLTLFPVEGVAMGIALANLPADKAHFIRETVKSAGSADRCPLLHDNLCLLYEARPVICRTHGLPLLIRRDGATGVDCCPLNFQGVESLPGSAIIDLERLNTLLTAINAHFIANAHFRMPMQERLTIADALLLDISEIMTRRG